MYKILSLDGGGIGGLYTASMLASWERACGVNVADYFDLIVGTSTGGIIALGLGAGMTGEEIVDFYKTQGAKIFKTSWLNRMNQLFRNKYNQDMLRQSLSIAFGDKLLGHSCTRIAIPTVDLEEMKPRVYKTAHHERFLYDYKKSVVEIALATSAAPTFFPSFSDEGIAFVDGGIWANNPVSVAVVEAISVLNWKPGDFKVLSIGCPVNKRSFGMLRTKGLAAWGLAQTEMFMHSASMNALNMAKLLSLHSDESPTIYRIQRTVQSEKQKLDNVETDYLKKLVGLGNRDAELNSDQIRAAFFQEKRHNFDFVYKL